MQRDGLQGAAKEHSVTPLKLLDDENEFQNPFSVILHEFPIGTNQPCVFARGSSGHCPQKSAHNPSTAGL